MRVSGPAALNVLTTVFTFGTAVVLVLYLPLLSFGRSPANPTSALPLPDAPANWPVLWLPDTVKGTVVENSKRQVEVDSSR